MSIGSVKRTCKREITQTREMMMRLAEDDRSQGVRLRREDQVKDKMNHHQMMRNCHAGDVDIEDTEKENALQGVEMLPTGTMTNT